MTAARNLMAIWIAAVLLALPALAQEEPPPEPAAGVETEAAGDTGAGEDPDASLPEIDPGSFSNIDELLEQDEEVLSRPGTYSYDPGVRRDPFRSLLQRRDVTSAQGERPEGIAGLLIDELELQGIWITEEGPVAQVMSASQDTSILLRPGDQLWDGDVVEIALGQVTFKQTINDPTALKPFREVVKQLNP